MMKFRSRWIQILIVLGVFLLFLANAVGLFELAFDVGETSSSIAAAVRTPQFLVLVLIGIVMSLALPVLSPIRASILTVVSMVPVFYLEYIPNQSRSLIPLEYSLLTILMLFVIHVLISYFTETHKKQKLVEAFGQYVPPEVVQRINEDPDRFQLAGEARELTVMFCDVHNFTGIAENVGPGQLADLLNTLFTPLTEVLYKHHGTIDKYIGDAIMAFWGAPIDDPRHAQNALSAAIEMQEVVENLGPVFDSKGLPRLTVGIGINTGVVSVGNMGSKYRMAYTVIGDAVNLASRIQELTRFYRTGIIVGEKTKTAAPILPYRELGLVRVKGKNEFARIYEPSNPNADPESTMVENMNRHNKALKLYYNREWDEAQAQFEQLQLRRKNDPIYPFYLNRIAEFRSNPPPKEWEGQIEFTVK